MNLPPLTVTVIGSWAFPGWYADFCARAKQFGPVDREEAIRDAVRLAIADQLDAGTELISDGEMTRVDFNLGFYDFLDGLEPLPPARLLGAPAHDQRDRYRAIRELSAPHGLGTVIEFQRLRSLTTAPIKMPVPGPFTLAGCIDGGQVYPHRRAVTEALLPIVNRELKALVAAGVTFLQLDEPSFACRPDAPDDFLDIIARTTDGVDAFISLHMCFGNYRARAVGRRSYRPLFPHLGRARVNQLALEFASREMAEIDLARHLPPEMGLAVGLIDVKNTWIEPPDYLADRLRLVLQHIEPERLHLTPDCGFSQTARHLACAKMANLTTAARLLRTERHLT